MKFINMLNRVIAYVRSYGVLKTIRKVLSKSAFMYLKKYDKASLDIYAETSNPSKCVEFLSEDTTRFLRQRKFKKSHKISVITPLYNTDRVYLTEMINSCINQVYQNWELCLVDASDQNHSYVGDIAASYSLADKRIKYKKLEKNEGISVNSNQALELSTGSYISLLDHDDIIHPLALYETATMIDAGADFVYTDEAKFSNSILDVYCPFCKPDFSLDYLRACNYICHFTTFSRELYNQTGGFRKEFDGAQDHDLFLRLIEHATCIKHITKVLYFWRAHINSTALSVDSKSYALDAGQNAVSSHLERLGIAAVVDRLKGIQIYKVSYALTSTPKVSIIIPNKDHLDDLKKCIDSVIGKTTYHDYDIVVVENNSESKEIFDYYDEIASDTRIKIIRFDGAFNYSKINNFAVSQCSSEYMILLNNDIEIITPDWIEQLFMFAQRSEVGIVGAKLYYPDNTIQHAGVIVVEGEMHHAYLGRPRNNVGYFGRLMIAQNYTAVTAACMMIKRSVFKEVGGFDENLAVAFNDVDLCLNVVKHGYQIIWTPFAEAYHYESKSRGLDTDEVNKKRFEGEVNYIRDKWSETILACDPYYNPNLSSVKPFALRDRSSLTREQSLHTQRK